MKQKFQVRFCRPVSMVTLGLSLTLPTFIDPKQLAGTRLKGAVALAQMSRLHESLYDSKGNVKIDWLFGLDDKQRPTIVGRVQAQLSLQCQRCLQAMPWAIDANVALMILKEGQTEDDLPVGYESLTLTKIPVSLTTLIEDELILALPIVVKHTDCPSNEFSQQMRESEKSEKSENNNNVQNNPFHVLSSLKISK
ncbi:hypothetical protein PN36_04790 [Candidatus Thiomargarita nelsonii]|uniref:Large ribosomal RNA subunit accumulation protein YceD n=1 Tax=Candidatus Thiomargarita nelsonii TaxID=1003181 RepID=A0A0A6PQB9_9GAMM|nr:hypothetical protein PN36_04790 [Candidatus Thiomargarita nelsonii]